ncbi:MAG: glycosyltransferase, partial [Chthoniobacterales bacterium]
ERSLPPDVRILKSKALSIKFTRRFGFGSLSFRATPFLRRTGNNLLKNEPFDAAFFSTTQFGTMVLAEEWRTRFGLPYVVDIQDPWVSNYDYLKDTPPGGRMKYAVSQFSARRKEPKIARGAAGIISVSPAYVADLKNRYPEIPANRFEVIPFPGAEKDFEFVKKEPVRQNIFDPNDGNIHWVYTGRGGSDLRKSLSGFFLSLRSWRERDPEIANKLRIHFIGTSYAPDGLGEKTVEPVAQTYGVADLVEEIPRRIPYFETLRCMLDASAIVVPGSDDAGYTASKIYPCILAEKPLLAIFHEKSSVLPLLEKTNAGTGIAFLPADTPECIAFRITASGWFQTGYKTLPTIISESFAPYLARAMTDRLCKVLDRAVK